MKNDCIIHPQLRTLPFVLRHFLWSSCLSLHHRHPPPPPLLWRRGVVGTYSSPPYCNSSCWPSRVSLSLFCLALLSLSSCYSEALALPLRTPVSESSLLICSRLPDPLCSIDTRMHTHKRSGRHLTPCSPVVHLKLSIYSLRLPSLWLVLSLLTHNFLQRRTPPYFPISLHLFLLSLPLLSSALSSSPCGSAAEPRVWC